MHATQREKRRRRLERLLKRLRARCYDNEESAALIQLVRARFTPARDRRPSTREESTP